MDIDTALKYMTIEKAIELEQRRFFCNADETINTISIHCMKKQIPAKVIKNDVYSQACPNCGYPVRWKFCANCGQALEY